MADEKMHILLIEDEAAHAALIRRAFETHAPHAAIEVVERLARARLVLERHTPDLILADWNLPDGQGTALLDHGDEPALPLVLMTSQGNEQVAVEALKAGALDYVVKSEHTMAEMPLIAERAIRQWALVRAHRQAQRALRESEARHRNLVENLSGLVCEFTPDGTLTFVNRAYAEYFGRTVEETVGFSLFELLPEPARADLRAHLDALTPENPLSVIEHEVVLPDGTRRWHEWTDRAFFDEAGQQTFFQSIGRDVTEQAAMRHALAESEQRYRQLFEQSPVAHTSTGTDGRLRAANAQAARLYGYPLDELIGKSVLELCAPTPEGIGRARELFEQFLAGEEIHDEVVEMCRSDGTHFWMSLSLAPLFDAEGNVFASHATSIDITERLHAEAALRESEERLRLALEAAEMGTWEWNAHEGGDAGRLSWSDGTEPLLGLPTGAFGNSYASYLEHVHPDDQDYIREAVVHALKFSDDFSVVNRIVLPGGEIRWMEARGKVYRDAEGRAIRTRGIVVDATERKHAEAALRESEERLRLALEAAEMGTWEWDVTSGQVKWSGQVESIFRMAPGTFDGTYDAYLRLIHPEDRPLVENYIGEALEGLRDYEVEHRFFSAEGEVCWLEARGKVYRDAQGRALHMRGTVVDVTARKRAEEELRQAQQRYKDLFEQAPLMYIVTRNENGVPHITDCNASLFENLGYERNEILGRSLLDFYTPESREKLLEDGGYQRALNARFGTEERQLVTRDGRVIETLLSAVPERDAAGHAWGTRAMYVDITERKRAERALREREAQLREAQQMAHLGSWDWNLALDTPIWSDEMFHIFGLDPADGPVTQERFGALFHPEDRDWVEGLLGAAIETHEPFDFYHRIIRTDGQERIVHVQGRVVVGETGLAERLHGTCHDVTEQKRADLAVRESEARLKEAQRVARLGTWNWDLTSNTQHWSEELYRLYGYEPGSVEDTFDSFIARVHPDDRAAVLKTTERTYGGHEDLTEEFRIVRPDGAVRTMLSSAKIFYDDAGHPIRMLGTVQDITERKEVEAMARAAQEELLRQQEREKARIEEQLARAEGRLVRQTRLATIGQMAASIAHELRNPLGAARNANFYLRRRARSMDPKWTEYLGIIEEEIRRADSIITDLLEMSRAKEPSKQAVPVAELVEDAFSQVPGREAVTLCVEARPGLVVHADAGQLRQVLINLLTNAVQAMEEGGVVRVEAGCADDYAVIRVQDAGPGVPEVHREEIFEPLFTTKTKGTGLGLAICRQIIERHGGTLALVEAEAPGAVFELRLPALQRCNEIPSRVNEGLSES